MNKFSHFKISNFFSLIRDHLLSFECRNTTEAGPSLLGLRDVIELNNYAMRYITIKSSQSKPIWNMSAAVLNPIKAKLSNYLDTAAINHRLKLLDETPRLEPEGATETPCDGIMTVYSASKAHHNQTTESLQIELTMNKDVCNQYRDLSKEFVQIMDNASIEVAKKLTMLMALEMQFMLGCDAEWKDATSLKSKESRSKVGKAPPVTVTPAADSGDDDSSSPATGSGDEGEGKLVDFKKIDPEDILTWPHWESVEFPDETETGFLARREAFAMAILFFLSEDLSDKISILSNQVHAGWLSAFGKPICMDALLDRDEKFDHVFEEVEEEWFISTMQMLVVSLSDDQRESRGITESHIAQLESLAAADQVHNNFKLCSVSAVTDA